MIIVRLVGGLGNQMFQYALGRNLAIINKVELKLDISELEIKPLSGTPRDYNLGVFNINENFATKEEVKKVKGFPNSRIFLILKKLLHIKKKGSVVREKQDYVFDPEILESGNNVYLQGYWNNEKYFRDIRNILLDEFTLKNSPDKKNQETLNLINSLNSVSLHVRRGDYVKDKKTNKHHGACSLEYYKKAVEIVAQKIKDPYFFAFSDDIDWVKKNLNLKYTIKYIDNNDDEHNYEDLRLMLSCKHNIIANSTFSWWGAWLNQNPDKIVIAPEQWVLDKSIDTSDVIPEEWIRI